MSSNKLRAPTLLREDIDRGRTGDKVNWPDPAAAPLGTDDEAGDSSLSLARSGLRETPILKSSARPATAGTMAERTEIPLEGPIPNKGLSRFNDEYGRTMMWVGLALVLAVFALFELL
jgi:hypothetical protein